MRFGWVLLVVGLASSQSKAMEFDVQHLKDQPANVIIWATGQIKLGDDRNLHNVVAALPANQRIIGVVLNSPGGNLFESGRLAMTLRNSRITTGVSGICASACFLMFMGGSTKMVFPDARIGVHSASEQSIETLGSQAATTEMARTAQTLGTPEAILGRMVVTPPDKIAWLSETDLRTIPGIKIVTQQDLASDKDGGEYQPGSALRPGGSPTARITPSPPSYTTPTPLPNSTATAAQPGVDLGSSPAFVAGHNARMAWESWFGGLTSDEHGGADWWASHRGTAARDRQTCESQFGMSQPWLIGCQQARQLLTLADQRRRADPIWKAGWNSL